MKHNNSMNYFAALLAGITLVSSGAGVNTAFVKAADQQDIGTTDDGYDYELWNQNGTGSATMQVGKEGSFTCSWNNIQNCLFRTGKRLGSTKTYKEYGNISITYDVDYQPNGNSYMCVYGWTQKPLVEYYIVEAWGDWRPPGSNNPKTQITVDRKSYDVYTSMRNNQPSIEGNTTFEQFWSVQKTNPAKVYSMTNLKGTITVSDHFAAWEKAGMKMGNMYEVALNIEGYMSNGKAEVKKNLLTIGEYDNLPTDQNQNQPQTTTPPDNNNNNNNNNNNSNPSAGGLTPKEAMAAAKANFTSTVPSDVKTGDKGTTKKITYYSKKAQREKPANVWLPPNYSESGSYPVLYMNHGVMGGENDMVSGWSIREMASNLIEKGEVKPFIIVFPQMYTDPASATAMGITQSSMDHYDDFLYDLTESLMPYMSEHYSVAEGRDNTAIAGFSMGGRESLYIGMKAADKIGYVCASSPAPGIVPAQDMFLNHRGSMTESEFKFSEPYIPYILMIGGGTADQVVGTFPKQYHELYDKNGTDNIWFEVPGAGHDASVGTPLFYNFFRNLFKAGSSSSSQQPAVTQPEQPQTTTPPVTTTPPPAATTTPSETTPPSAAPAVIYGDLDGSDSVDLSDLTMLSQYLLSDVQLTSEQRAAADVTGDGTINISDLALLKQYVMKDNVTLGGKK